MIAELVCSSTSTSGRWLLAFMNVLRKALLPSPATVSGPTSLIVGLIRCTSWAMASKHRL